MELSQKEKLLKLFIYKRWPWHVSLWLLYFSVELPSYFFTNHQPPNLWQLGLIQDGCLVALTYTIIFILFPLFYKKEKYFAFLISILVNAMLFNLLVGLLIKDKINEYVTEVSKLPEVTLMETFVQGISIAVLFTIFVVMSKIAKDFFIKQYHDSQVKKFQMQSELENLKAQLSPHFLFNTMNNFYGLAVDKSSKLPNLMLRLSDLMRYSLYETKNENVRLENEVNYLLNYIELEKIRLEDTLQVEFNYSIDEIKHYEIAPLLLIVFVENAFKHSRNSENEIIKIKINLQIVNEGWFYFTVENNHSLLSKNVYMNESSGIGIQNAKKRLDVIYPSDLHELEIVKTDSTFTIILKIKLSFN